MSKRYHPMTLSGERVQSSSCLIHILVVMICILQASDDLVRHALRKSEVSHLR